MKTLRFACYSTILFISGYFTSRPALKGYVRRMNSLLQSCKQLNVFGTQLPRKMGATPYRLGECVCVCVCGCECVCGSVRLAEEFS